MPVKQTREPIESELAKSETDWVIRELRSVKKDLEEQIQAETSVLTQLMAILDGRRGH
jgi:hypothetical protein